MSTRSHQPHPPRDEDDEIDELPPLEDGDDVEGTGEEDAGVDDARGEASDDVEAGDLVAAEEIDEDIGDGDGEEADDLDVGDDEIDENPDARTAADDEAQGGNDELHDLVGGLLHPDDGGEEGTEAPDPHDEDELPPLDGDEDDDETEDPDVLVFEPKVARRDAALPPWEDAAWTQVDVDAPRVALSMVVAKHGMVTAVGDALLEIAPGSRQAFARPVSASRDAMVAITAHAGGIRVISHANGDVLSVAKKEISPLPEAPRRHFVGLAATSGDRASVLGLTDEGELARLDGSTWASLALPPIRALGCDGEMVTIVTDSLDDAKIMTSDDGGRSWEARPLDAEHDPTGVRSIAVAKDAVALLGSSVAISRGRSLPLETPDGCDRALAAAFAGSSETSSLLLLLARDEGVYVARIDAENRAWLVADLTRDEDPPSSASLAWDESRNCLWIACSWGLLALMPPR